MKVLITGENELESALPGGAPAFPTGVLYVFFWDYGLNGTFPFGFLKRKREQKPWMHSTQDADTLTLFSSF